MGGNCSCSSTDEGTDGDNNCDDRDIGNSTLNFENAKLIHVEPHVDRRSTTIINSVINNRSEPDVNPSQGVKSCCKNINDDGNKLCDVFKNRLKDFYCGLTLPKVAWLDEGSDLSIVEHFMQLQLSESKKSVEVENIFSEVNKKPPLRILIEGQPGFGKTTLATKLAYNWATTQKYINFEFAFFLPLRELQQRGIEDAIYQVGRHCDCDNAVEIVNNHKKNTLFILDGLDEVLQEDRKEIMEILYKHKYSDVTVVVFCRTGLFAVSKDERRQLFGLPNMRDVFSDKRISTLGVMSEKKKLQFLEKFVPKSTIDKVIGRLSLQWRLFDSPLFLMLVSIILQEDENFEEFSTKTQFFKKLFNCILKHSYIKHGRHIHSDFDLFHFDSTVNAIQERMREFGMLSLTKIVQCDLKFEATYLTNEIYELGFLIHHKEMTYVKSKNYYEALHLSIIEFTAAFALSVDLQFNQSPSTENYLKSITNQFLETHGMSLIMHFFTSLMGDDLDHFLAIIDSFSMWFSLDFYSIAELLSECSSKDFSLSRRLRDFIPSHVVLHDCEGHKRILRELLKYGIQCGKIERITFDELTNPKIFANNITVCLQIQFASKLEREFSVVCTVPCVTSQVFSKPIPFHGSMNECLHFAASPNVESCALKFSSCSTIVTRAVTDFLQSMTKEYNIFKQIKFCYLEITIRTESEKQVIIQLLKNNQVQFLKLSTSEQNKTSTMHMNMNDFACIAANSSYLTRISLSYITIDLFDLTNGGTKKYTYICLQYCTLTCRKPLVFRNCCYHLEIDSLQNVEAIIQLEPSKFGCRLLNVINDLIKKFPRWTGFNSITSLSLIEPNDAVLNSVSRWINLQTLELEFHYSAPKETFANCIHSLPIENLIIVNSYLGISNLFKYMNNLWALKNNSQLKTIILNNNGCTESSLEVSELVEGLKCNYWDKVNLVASKVELCKLREELSTLDVLITHSDYKSIYQELNRFKNYYGSYLCRHYTGLTITRKPANE